MCYIRYRWGAYISPASYFIAGAFNNEFRGNSSALGDHSYDSLANFFGFSVGRWTCLAALVALSTGYHFLWLCTLYVADMRRRAQLLDLCSLGSASVTLQKEVSNNNQTIGLVRSNQSNQVDVMLARSQSRSVGTMDDSMEYVSFRDTRTRQSVQSFGKGNVAPANGGRKSSLIGNISDIL